MMYLKRGVRWRSVWAAILLVPAFINLVWATDSDGGSLFLEVRSGLPLNLSSDLRISQEGEPDLEFGASFRSRPLEMPLYYDIRLVRWHGATGWGLDFLHHKLILSNPPAEVPSFEITHGFNLLTLQRLWNLSGALWMMGVGLVVAHPENRVRERELTDDGGWLGGGYHLTGPVVCAGVGRQFPLGSGFLLSVAGRLVLVRVELPVAGGDASMPHVSGHFLLGMAYRLH
ncbi:MAG: hypothetical protein ABIF77_09770 [bacterium]